MSLNRNLGKERIIGRVPMCSCLGTYVKRIQFTSRTPFASLTLTPARSRVNNWNQVPNKQIKWLIATHNVPTRIPIMCYATSLFVMLQKHLGDNASDF